MVTFQFVQYDDLEGMDSSRKVTKLISIVKQGKIVLFQGKLKKEEEANLIEKTMELVDDKFRGIELSVINPKRKLDGWNKMKYMVINSILGDRQGFTIIGPADIVKRIEQNPNKIELFMNLKRRRR